jgi:NAD(P)-dependent dehydrogenase (short-subunit alcohol dehydrogenase family)
MDVRGSAAIVGGGSGIGRGIALALADVGVNVAIGDIDEVGAAETRDLATAKGVRAVAVKVDGTDRSSLEAFADQAEAELGSVNLLSTNVGVVIDQPLASATEADWAWVIEFNLMSAVRAVDVFLPQLRQHPGEAAIVVTSSMAGLLATTGRSGNGNSLGIYVATKHALRGYAECLRYELAPEDIKVSLLCPGLVATNLGFTSARHRPEKYGGRLPDPDQLGLPRPGAMDPADLGRLVVAAVEADRFAIVTPAAARRQLERRQQRLLDDLDFLAALEA